MDSASLKEIIPNPNWKEEANSRIEQIRKADITLKYYSMIFRNIFEKINIETNL